MNTQIESQAVLYNKVGDDENYTPAYAVTPLLEFINPDAIIWCPFDTEDSEFVKILSERAIVIRSHINEGKDFFTYEPQVWDIIISNPPFENKKKFFERALSFNKPFALLMSNTWLNDSAPKLLFEHKALQLLLFDKRIKYTNNAGRPNNKITFSSSYYCYNFLPSQIIIRKLTQPKGS